MSASSAKHAVVRAKLKFTSRAEFVEGFLPLVSKGGLFIRTKASKPESTPIRFEFRLDDDTPVFVGEGVVRTELPYDPSNPRQPYGMLVSLRKLNRASKDVLDEILALKASRRAAPPTPSDAATPASPIRAAEPPTPAAPVAAAPSEVATPATPVPAAPLPAEPLPAPAERVYRPEPDPSLPRPQLLAAPEPDDDVEEEDEAEQPIAERQTLDGGMARDLRAEADEASVDALFGDPVPEAAPLDAPAEPEPEPEPEPADDAPVESIFGGAGDDDDDDPFGGSLFGDGLEDELDGIFAEAGMVSDGSFDMTEGPADLFGSAVHFGTPDEDEPAELETDSGGGGLISLGEDEIEDDDDDFFDDDDEEDEEEDAPAEASHVEPDDIGGDDDEPFLAASEAEPTTPFARPDADFFAEHGVDDDAADVEPAEMLGDPVPEAAPLDEPAFAQPEPEPEPEPEEDVEEEEGFELLDADDLDEVDEIPAAAPAAPAAGGFQFKLKAPPPPGGTRLPPPRLPPPRLPPPPGRKAPAPSAQANPLDDVSVDASELPPPPAPASFKNPSLNDLQGGDEEDKAGGGLFNKLFGKES